MPGPACPGPLLLPGFTVDSRRAPQNGLDEPGTILIQIDGLAEPIFRRAVESGELPTL